MLNAAHCLALLAACALPAPASRAAPIEVSSPGNTLKVMVGSGDNIIYTITSRAEGVLLRDNEIQLRLAAETLGKNPRLLAQRRDTINEEIRPAVHFKSAVVKNHCNRLILDFEGDYSLEFRVFDDGVAYRLSTRKPGRIDILHETIGINFPSDYHLHLQLPKKRGFASYYEEPYSHLDASQLGEMALLPILIDTKNGSKILFSEADIEDYPNAFFERGENGPGLKSIFPGVPLETKPDRGRTLVVTKSAARIATTAGARDFPWRFFVITGKDGGLLENTMLARLARQPAAGADFSWVKPGLALWDWMNRAHPFGKEAAHPRGINTESCKLYIDYAAKHSIPYYIIDAQWSTDVGRPVKPKPNLDLVEVLRHARERKIGVLLWVSTLGVQRDFDDDSYNLFEQYSKMGVAGFKVDFMDRSDQAIVNYYKRVAEEAAKYKMLVELHGSYKPVGLEYQYPNILSFEGVRGMENHLNCTPDNSLWLPFIRNVLGPMSFTPGSLTNVQPDKTKGGFDDGRWPMIGTRAHHMAYYVLFESGLQMIADSPWLFDKNPDCAKFIFSAPVTWDETRALAAEAGQYAISARRHGAKWWLGGITNNAKKTRSFNLALDFLAPGKTYTLTLFEDGPAAASDAMDYTLRTQTVRKGDKLRVKLVRNGGLAATIE
jgi:alpha-glucosidase